MIKDNDLRSIQQVRQFLAEAKTAQAEFKTFSQQQVDRIFSAMADGGYAAAEELAKIAVEETGYGKVADKKIKNQFATRDTFEAYIKLKTVGVTHENKERKIIEIAEPVGIVAAVIPTTNPTSTALFKTLIAIKSRNAIIVSPHPRAARCTCAAVEVMARAAEQAGAPKGLIHCLTELDMKGTEELMSARETSVILATGGPSLVKAAYSAGKPAFGVGPGNVPVYIDRSANVEKAISDVVTSKTFDWGTICSSEQALVIDAPVYDRAVAELKMRNAHFLSEGEMEKVGKILVGTKGIINPELVGHSPQAIAQAAGISIPAETQLLIAPLSKIGRDIPLSLEKLSPVLALYIVNGWEEGCEHCIALLKLGGRGHTLSIHCQNQDIIMKFGLEKPASRIVVNTPSSMGAIGFTTGLDPSMTLGCGAAGGNVTGDNISPLHLLNTKRIAMEVRPLKNQPDPNAAWHPQFSGQNSSGDFSFPYQKVFDNTVSRKGCTVASKEETKQHREKIWAKQTETTMPSAADNKNSKQLSSSEIDALAARFRRERKI